MKSLRKALILSGGENLDGQKTRSRRYQNTCSVCGGNGIYIADCPDIPEFHGRTLVCDCEDGQAFKESRQARLRGISELPTRLAHCTIDSYLELDLSEQQRAAAAIAQRYAQRGQLIAKTGAVKSGLFLCGEVGTGKSGLAAAISNEALARGVTVQYRTTPDLLDYIRSTFNPNSSDDYGDVLGRIKRVDLLVLDDIGAESPTAWVTEKLYQIIDFRYRHNLRIIATSNLNPADLAAHFSKVGDQTGLRITDRLMEMCAIVEVSGHNLRR